MLDTGKNRLLRSLPAVDALLRDPAAADLLASHGRVVLTGALREALLLARREILSGASSDISVESLLSVASSLLPERGLRRVVNATGVVLHTNLGRSVLSERALEAVAEAGGAYSNLEYDLSAGERGSRYDHSVGLLTRLTGAQDALVVNNCAGATLLALAAVAGGGDGSEPPEVVVSRGQLIEIGGGFRIPEVLEVSGVRLVEVGTTNRTRLSDYERAITENTRAVLWVHPSNFAVRGFTETVGVSELATLGPPVIADVGSGALASPDDFADEPRVREVVRAGADLVLFSGDKLLGGPQAGISVGSGALIRSMRSHPLTRALRADKLCLAALEATLRSYLEETVEEDLPALRMLRAPLEEVEARAHALADALAGSLRETALRPEVVPSAARSGGGTLPLHEIPSFAVQLSGPDPDALAARFRGAEVPVIGRVHEGSVLLDARTLLPGDEDLVVEAARCIPEDVPE